MKHLLNRSFAKRSHLTFPRLLWLYRYIFSKAKIFSVSFFAINFRNSLLYGVIIVFFGGMELSAYLQNHLYAAPVSIISGAVTSIATYLKTPDMVKVVHLGNTYQEYHPENKKYAALKWGISVAVISYIITFFYVSGLTAESYLHQVRYSLSCCQKQSVISLLVEYDQDKDRVSLIKKLLEYYDGYGNPQREIMAVLDNQEKQLKILAKLLIRVKKRSGGDRHIMEQATELSFKINMLIGRIEHVKRYMKK